MDNKNESQTDKLMRWIRSQTSKTVRYQLLGFEAKKFLLFVAVPIGIYILFRDTERVAKMNRYFKPQISSPEPRLEYIPKDLFQRYRAGESVEHILQSYHDEMKEKERRRAEREEKLRMLREGKKE